MKHKKTLFTFLLLCGLFVLSKPVSAAKVPVIRAGKSTNLKGTIINVKYRGTAVTMADNAAAPSRLVLIFLYHAKRFFLIMESMQLMQQMEIKLH